MMDVDFRNFLRTAQGDEPPVSVADPRWAETEALASKLISSAQAEAALRALKQEPLAKKRWDMLLLAGLLHQGLGERAPSLEAIEIVGDKLAAAGEREGVRALMPRFLSPEPVSAAVRFLHFLAKGAADDAERIDLLNQALEIRPEDPELHFELSQTLERTASPDAARTERLRALEIWLDLTHHERVAEELLRTVEEDLPASPRRVAHILLRYAAQAPWTDAEPILDLAMPELANRATGLITWEEVGPVAIRVPESPGARRLFAALMRIAVTAEPDPDAIVECSGIKNPGEPMTLVSARVPKILSLPPGAYVAHATWGFGRVATNDGESVSLDFPGRAGHKMSLGMAAKSLDILPGDGLRVMMATAPDRVRELVAACDAQIVFSALRDIGGTATLPQLKPRIEPALLGTEWAGWWKETKENLKSDGRLDLSEAYRQIFKLATEGQGAAEVVLPELAPRAGEQGLGVIRKFLREHPDLEARMANHASVLVARWAADTNLELVLRAQALLFALSWGSLTKDSARAVLDGLIEGGLSPVDLTLGQQQDALVELAQTSPQEQEFLWRAMESRLPRLRDRARVRMIEILGEGFARAVQDRLTRAAENPSLATRLIEQYAPRPTDAGAPPTAVLLLATLRLLERDLEAGAAERLLEMLQPEGAFARLLKQAPLDTESLESVERTVLHWRGSERRLHPILEFLSGLGHGDMVIAYESRRSARAQSLLEGKSIEDLETRHTVMTRTTFEKLEVEAKRLRLDLKTTIPAAIEKARQMGDLRENAEYEAAKQRQANAAARMQELMNLLENTRLLETIAIDETRIGVGTEVTLEPLDTPLAEPVRYWILGEGDHGLGHGILSYRAPILKPLLGKPVGAEVEIELPDGTHRYRVASIKKRVPGETA